MGKSCFLCFNMSFICVNDSDLTVKIQKYLDIFIERSGPTLLCAFCIEAVEKFHAFYEKIRSIHWFNTTRNNIQSEINCESRVIIEECDSPKKPAKKNEINEVEVDTPTDVEAIESTDASEYLEDSSDSCYSFELPKRRKPKENLKLSTYKRKKNKRTLNGKKVDKELNRFYCEVICPLCEDGVEHSNLKTLCIHFKRVHEEAPFIKCCGKLFKLEDKFRLRRHLQIHINPDCCKCDICGKLLSSPRHVKLHKELHIPEKERSLECSECGRKCSGNAELYRHVRSVHAPQDCVCDICGKEFRKRVTFLLHMRTTHQHPEKTFVCEACAKTYKTLASLQQHMQTAHSVDYTPKTKQCHECGKWMGAMYLKKHMIRLHGAEAQHDCNICGKLFKLPSDLRSHQVVHSAERPYPCPGCSSTFKTKATLKIHKAQHTGGNSIKCPFCEKVISNMANFLAHRRRMHSAEHERAKSATVILEETVVSENVDIYCKESTTT